MAVNNSEANLLLKDRFAYTVLSHTDLTRETGQTGDIDLSRINWGNYDLVVIDESHNFRNDAFGKKMTMVNHVKHAMKNSLKM